MIIWLSMAVPVVTALVLLVFFKHQTVWWEFCLPLLVSILLISGMKSCVESSQVTDTEFLGGAATQATYDEPWDEEVPCSHTKYCDDGDGNSYPCGTEHIYDVDYHGPRWRVVDSNGFDLGINKEHFEELASRWGNREFVDMRRDFHSQDGDRYVTKWNWDRLDLLEPITVTHKYENRVAASGSSSIFKFEEIADPRSEGLIDYPSPNFRHYLPAVLGPYVDGEVRTEAEKTLQVANSLLGHTKQLRLFVLLFDASKFPNMSTGMRQEAYWKGGNKNEFVVALGYNESGGFEWSYPFSWTERDGLKVDARELAFEVENLGIYTKALVPLVEQQWKRREFKEFDYLTVEPPLWAVITTFLITVLVNLGLSCWLVLNEHREFRGFLRRGRNW